MKSLVLAIFMAAALAGPVWAQADQDRAHDGVRAGELRPFSQIKNSLERQFRGRVLDVQMRGQGRNSSYDVKLITNDGDVIMVETDAATGRVKNVRGGRR